MDPTIRWLHENTKNRFANPNAVNVLVENALAQYRTLQPKVAQYISENGVREALLCLHGTLPVVFGGSTFNIPVVFWFPREFPEHPPMTFVTPTRKMVVKVSKYVDGRGRVYHPYMAEWSAASTLTELFQNLIALFSKEPPVYSTPAANVAVSSKPPIASPHIPLSSASMASLPLTGTISMASLPQTAPAAISMPAMPGTPRPTTAASQKASFLRPLSSIENDLASVSIQATANSHAPSPGRQQITNSTHNPVDSAEQEIAKISFDSHAPQPKAQDILSEPPQTSQHQQQSSSYKFNPVVGRPPIPAMSPATSTSKPGSDNTLPVGGASAATEILAISAIGGRRHSYASESDSLNEQAKRWSTTDSALSFTDEPDQEQTPSNALSTTRPLESTSSSVAAATTESVPVITSTTPTTATAATTPSGAVAISTTVGTPAVTGPKLATSPVTTQQQSSLLDREPMDDPQKRLVGYQLAILEKVIEAVDKSREKHTRVNKELLDQSANLNSGAGVISEERHQLLESQRQLSANISVLENKLSELNEKKNGFPDGSQITDVCQVFRGQTPAMEQLFGLAGEISAIDDTLYILGKALNDGRLPLSIYMRQIRKLAQQQFMAKALAIKIRKICLLDK
ncbi:suppressor protein stp22 of temperature-sensitive alpha-factor receptor and arginine permease [Coemansia spiralis]|uniref:Suppressor protein stp22 of temperature-sensitive alpha-factor receptor and arginine permease n=2 Tax=Coemansia TaxID=4863 RepID=A0A9W8GDI8_9FUNG|nr:UEV domain-containing protein [Coemansia spiralis]KAJ1993787.1 suppressor protein stp22 of temperature-sensitive alpha-factor receptor and arginine permease [Coemansia umbellata]KAJ2623163.1 suppressor protein stp22 of temperature-sensitive alpha-factor receptor and arginine permease [Coemansia sp. RSA 1358]KAJ2680041.1 suppressor protein stp22 of temperature-sensitive alpha-factor receptor and arginine permease [Coemansia spiralis]